MTASQILGLAILFALYLLAHFNGVKLGRQKALIGVLDAIQKEIETRKKKDCLTKDQMVFVESFFERIREM
jgi:hypothetical protein